jgi:PKHD-type hydroxylase
MSKLFFYKTNCELGFDFRDIIKTKINSLTTAVQGSDALPNKVRKSKVTWIPTNHWISGLLSHYIHDANHHLYQYDITHWESDIQYTVYDFGDKYGWHVDTTDNIINPRKLSISLCLSSIDEYDGGEFQILTGRTVNTIKMNLGDVLVFPSDCWHRVKKVKSGQRISLVGWYTGPRFK